MADSRTRTHGAEAVSIADRIGRLHAQLAWQLDAVVRPLGLTAGQAIALFVLSEEGQGRSQTAWAHSLGFSRQHAHALCRALADRGALLRQVRGREVHVRVSARGRRLVERTRPAVEARLAPLLEGLPAAEIRRFVRTLERLASRVPDLERR
ncbi:MAG: MarR family winged helix-turn-helix transcriptional regulator [Myxococcota bacterium]